jgi:hypothetical protein
MIDHTAGWAHHRNVDGVESQTRLPLQSDPNTVESGLNNPTTAKPSLQHRATEELKEFLILSLYLYVCLGAIIIMKSAILNSVGVEFDLWGIAAIKALLLAKFMLIGKALHLGENKNRPLAWPTLYQSALTLVLLIILTALEEILVGALHQRTIKESLTHVAGDRLDMVLATFLIMFLILVPYFAFRNLAEVLGPGILPRLFFTDPVRRPFPPPP